MAKRQIELSSQGFNQSDIARILEINKSIISRDMVYLRQQAKERLRTHISDTMPVEYQKGMAAIDQVLRMCWAVVGRTNDERVRLQALALIDQCNAHKMEMVTNGSIVSDALKYVTAKTEKLNNSVSNAALEEEEDYQTTVTEETETKN